MKCNWTVIDHDKGFRHGQQKDIDILIGCPVQKRDWIISEWFWHVNSACKVAGVHPAFIFVMDPSEEPLNTMVHNNARLATTRLIVGEVEEEEREDKRNWGKLRYEKMVDLRNLLLEGVREQSHPLFLSLDSDILLHPDSLKSMIANLGDYDAIGGKAYMTHTGTMHPSYGVFKGGSKMIRRADSEGVFDVDVIMAIKLMKPSAYSQDYRFDSQGEDVGWSRNCKESGLRLRWDGSVANKHVMRKQDLGNIDKRVGF